MVECAVYSLCDELFSLFKIHPCYCKCPQSVFVVALRVNLPRTNFISQNSLCVLPIRVWDLKSDAAVLLFFPLDFSNSHVLIHPDDVGRQHLSLLLLQHLWLFTNTLPKAMAKGLSIATGYKAGDTGSTVHQNPSSWCRLVLAVFFGSLPFLPSCYPRDF